MENAPSAVQQRFTLAIIPFTMRLWSKLKRGQIYFLCNVICASLAEPWSCTRRNDHQVCLGRIKRLRMKSRRVRIGRKFDLIRLISPQAPSLAPLPFPLSLIPYPFPPFPLPFPPIPYSLLSIFRSLF